MCKIVTSICRLCFLLSATLFFTSCGPSASGKVPSGCAKLVIGSDGIYTKSLASSFGPLYPAEYIDPAQASYLRIVKKSSDPDGNLKIPDAVIIDGKVRMVEQCGVYRFDIYVDGAKIVIDDFHYAGEPYKMVARGIGWYIYITRDEEL